MSVALLSRVVWMSLHSHSPTSKLARAFFSLESPDYFWLPGYLYASCLHRSVTFSIYVASFEGFWIFRLSWKEIRLGITKGNSLRLWLLKRHYYHFSHWCIIFSFIFIIIKFEALEKIIDKIGDVLHILIVCI